MSYIGLEKFWFASFLVEMGLLRNFNARWTVGRGERKEFHVKKYSMETSSTPHPFRTWKQNITIFKQHNKNRDMKNFNFWPNLMVDFPVGSMPPIESSSKSIHVIYEWSPNISIQVLSNLSTRSSPFTPDLPLVTTTPGVVLPFPIEKLL